MANKMCNIERIDTEINRTHSWFVIVQRYNIKHTKSFTDGVYGSKEKALECAIKWRDEIKLKHPPMSKKEYASIKRGNNNSGVVGVCRIESKDILASGQEVIRCYWVASWAVPIKRTRKKGQKSSKTKSVKFSINRLGEDKAFKMACTSRRRAVSEIEGTFLPNQ